jgi:two-component sensor histidine kinase
MARVHEQLHRPEGAGRVELAEYLRGVVDAAYEGILSRVTRELDLRRAFVEPETAIALGLIVNELATNTAKYAFPDGVAGTLRVLVTHQDPEHAIVSVSNDGIAFDAAESNGTGVRLIRALATQIGGDFVFDGRDGLRFSIPVRTLQDRPRHA